MSTHDGATPAEKAQSPSSPVEQEEEEWQAVLDPTTNAYYFWNVNTNEVSWEDPKKKATGAPAPAAPSPAPKSSVAAAAPELNSILADLNGTSSIDAAATKSHDASKPPPYPDTTDPQDPTYKAYYQWYLAQTAAQPKGSDASGQANTPAWGYTASGQAPAQPIVPSLAPSVPQASGQPGDLIQRQAMKQMSAFFDVEQYQEERNAAKGKTAAKFTKKQIQTLKKRKEEQKQKRKNAWLYQD